MRKYQLSLIILASLTLASLCLAQSTLQLHKFCCVVAEKGVD